MGTGNPRWTQVPTEFEWDNERQQQRYDGNVYTGVRKHLDLTHDPIVFYSFVREHGQPNTVGMLNTGSIGSDMDLTVVHDVNGAGYTDIFNPKQGPAGEAGDSTFLRATYFDGNTIYMPVTTDPAGGWSGNRLPGTAIFDGAMGLDPLSRGYTIQFVAKTNDSPLAGAVVFTDYFAILPNLFDSNPYWVTFTTEVGSGLYNGIQNDSGFTTGGLAWIPDYQWHHYALSVDILPGSMRLRDYVDGINCHDLSLAGSPDLSNECRLCIGGDFDGVNPMGSQWHGFVHSYKVTGGVQGALTPEQILAECNRVLPGRIGR